MIDHVLFIGFGGPARYEEVWPFLQRVAEGTRIPEARLREVESHYRRVGGSSPYNDHAHRLVLAVERKLRAAGASGGASASASRPAGVKIPLFLGMRNWHPLLAEVVGEIKGRGLRHGLAAVLAPHRSEASFGRYLRSLKDACQEVGAEIAYEPLPPWHEDPLFIGALAERTGLTWQGARGWQVLFTAHSIPLEMEGASSYQREVGATARRVAERLGIEDWSVAFQSRSGPPDQAWLGPDVLEAIGSLKARGRRGVTVVPIGFLFDHTEVLYDLDVQAKQVAESAGLEFRRAATVMDHSDFAQMFAQLIQARVPAEEVKR